MVADLARWLRGRGVAPVIGCLDLLGELGEALEAEGVPCHLFERRPGFDRGLGRRIAERVAADGIDLIHGHQYTPFFFGMLAKRRCGVPLLFTEHGRFHPDRPGLRRQVFNRTVGRGVDHITAVSEQVRDALVRVEGFPAGRIEVLPNGIDPAPFTGLPREEGAFARAWGIPEGAPLVGTIARLNPIKNQALLIDAFREVRAAVPEAHLVIVGDGELKDDLAERATADGMADAVHLVGQHDDVRPWLGRMDLFALSSLSEGMPMTLLEAMAAGVPIVSTDVGGIRGMVAPGTEALLVPSGDRAALAHALSGLLKDPDRRHALAAAARTRLEREFTLDAVGGRYLEIYGDLCPGTGA
jgi:glycosyltransferase involved in cell wall biosynthesis